MLSIILNIITILIVLAIVVLFLRLYYNVKSKTVDEDKDVTASDVVQDIIKDPLVVSRAYFTEPKTGNIGTFKGQQTQSQYDWISGKTIPVEE